MKTIIPSTLLFFPYSIFACTDSLFSPHTFALTFSTMFFVALLPIALVLFLILRIVPKYRGRGTKWALKRVRSFVVLMCGVAVVFLIVGSFVYNNYFVEEQILPEGMSALC